MNAVSMNNLWNYLQGLSLTASNQRWLAERLLESSEKESVVEGIPRKKLVFPKIGKDFKVSQEVLDIRRIYKEMALSRESGALQEELRVVSDRLDGFI